MSEERRTKPIIKIGDRSLDLSDVGIISSDMVSMRYDPAKLVPVMFPYDDYVAVCNGIGVPELAQFPDREKSAKKYWKHVREGTQALASVVTSIITDPNFSGDGVLVAFTAEPIEDEPAEEPAEEVEENAQTQTKGKGKGKSRAST